MRHIFITGFWRSGTSLLLRLLDGHPQVYAMPHMTGMITLLEKYPDFLDTLKKCCDPYQLLSLLGHHSIVSNFRHIISASFDGMSFTEDGVRYPFIFDFEAFSRCFFKHLHEATRLNQVVMGYYESIRNGWINCTYNRGFRVYAQQQGHRNFLYPGEDTVRFVVNNIPDMVAIELVRDPVFQIGSAMRAEPGLSLENGIVQWAFAYNRVRNCLKRYPDRYAMLRYEELMNDPERVMRNVAVNMEIEFHDCLLKPTFNAQPWSGNSQFTRDKSFSARKNPKLPFTQVEYIQKSLTAEREKLGYPIYTEASFSFEK